jgi:outer membrane protein OmpA-like peptidoglycan-associated protein
VPDTDLEALGKQRAQAIKDLLLAGGEVDPSRIFMVSAPPKSDAGEKVKLELAVK